MTDESTHQITRLLHAWRGGDEAALDEMMPLVYRQLKAIAGGLMRRERDGNTLVSTALVHETYMRLADLEGVDWNDRSHFFALCSRVMRRVLVDHARAHNREKRGGHAQRVDASELLRLGTARDPDLEALDDALSALAEHDPQMAKVVELRFFGGLEREAIAQVLNISSATVTRRWRTARAWLIHELSGT